MKQQQHLESKIIDRAQHGDADAFGELYKAHLDAMYSYISKRVGEVNEVENLTQTVFLKAWQALERYKPSKVPFRAWLYRIAHNTVIDYYRTKKETASLEEHTMIPTNTLNSPEETIVSKERNETLRQAITKLRPAYQQVLSLRFLSGLGYSETAKVLGRQVNAVRVLQFRALQSLHKVLTQKRTG